MPFNQDGEECLKALAGTGQEQLNKYSLYIKTHLFERRGKKEDIWESLNLKEEKTNSYLGALAKGMILGLIHK